MTYNIHIENSYKISKWDFKNTLITRRVYATSDELDVFAHRSYLSMQLEWCCHNFLYNLGVARERTKDVDLNYPQKLWEKILYPIGGILTWIFIR